MSIIYGEADPPTKAYPSLYEYFTHTSVKHDAKNKPLLITNDGNVNFKDFDPMVGALATWLHGKLKHSLEEYIKTSYGFSSWEDPEDSLSKCYVKLWKNIKEKLQRESNTEIRKTELVIAICLKRGPELAALLLAIWKLHLPFVPIDPNIPQSRTIKILKDTDPVLIICDRNSINGFKELITNSTANEDSQHSSSSSTTELNDLVKYTSRIVNLEEWKLFLFKSSTGIKLKYEHQKHFSETMYYPNECSCTNSLSCILYTSGTSGVPKGVRITTKNIINRIDWQLKEYPFDSSKDVCLWSKIYTFIDSYTEILCPLIAGTTTVIARESIINPENVVKYVSQHKITRLLFIPSFFKILILYFSSAKDAINIFKSTVNLWIVSGEPMPKYLIKKFFDLFPQSKLVNFYGATEITGDVTHSTLSLASTEDPNGVPLGTPISNTAAFIFYSDKNSLKVLSEGEVGEIAIVGHNTCDGYYKGNLRISHPEDTFHTLGSFNFQEKNDVKNLHNYLNDINFFTGERYGIMEQTFSASTKNLHQSFLQYSERSGAGSLNICPASEILSLQSDSSSCETDPRTKFRSCTPPTSSSNSQIVADEVELSNRYKGVKSFPEAGSLQQEQIPRRASIPASSDTNTGNFDKRAFPLKNKFKPNIKTTAELITTEINKMSLSSITGILTSRNKSNTSVENFFPTSIFQHPIQEFSKISNPFTSSEPTSPANLIMERTSTSASIAAFYPSVSASVSQTLYVLKQISTNTREKLAVYATGDIGKIEKGVLYFYGRKGSHVKVKGIRIDLAEIDSVIRKAEAVETHHLIAVQENEEEEEEKTEFAVKKVDTCKAVQNSTGEDAQDSSSPKDGPNQKDVSQNQELLERKETNSATTPIPSSVLSQTSTHQENKEKHFSGSQNNGSALCSIIAFIVLKEKSDSKEVELSEGLQLHLKQHLPDPMIPQLIIMDQLPLLPNGKVDDAKLRQWFWSRRKEMMKKTILFMKKKEPIELKVLRVICDTIGLPFSVKLLQKNFFSIGGTSMSSVVVVVRLREMGFELTLDTFLKAHNLANVVHDILKAKTRAEVVHLFSPPLSSTRQPTGEAKSISLTEEMEDSDKSESGEEDQEEVEWMETTDEAKVLTLHPDLPSLLVGGDCESEQSPEGPLVEPSIPLRSKIKLRQLYTTPLPNEGSDKDATIRLIAKSFIKRNPLDIALGIEEDSQKQFMETLWPILVRQELSFVVRDIKSDIVGAMISTDFFDVPQVDIPEKMTPITAIHEVLENDARNQIPKEEAALNVWVNNKFLATSCNLRPQDNVRLALHLEKELLKLAAKRGYQGVFTINSNPTNQLLCSHYLGYENLTSLLVHSFEHEGKLPFENASKDLSLVAASKSLNRC